ncbi:MAG: hypothetical protein IPJ84_11670 [Bdellovibrionales bacterium]|nr:hypothetical protein [Bdellovibrionales bacterium]
MKVLDVVFDEAFDVVDILLPGFEIRADSLCGVLDLFDFAVDFANEGVDFLDRLLNLKRV